MLAAYGLLAALRDDSPAVPDVAGFATDGKNGTALLSAQGIPGTGRSVNACTWRGLMTVKCRRSSVAISVSPRRSAMAPDGRRAPCHGLAATPVSFLPSQTGSSHPPDAYRMARLPVSPGQAA